MSDFNLDSVEDSGYTPVSVTYREKEYLLGDSAYGLMMVSTVVDSKKGKGKKREVTGGELIKKLPKLLELLSPSLAKAMTDPTIAEQVLLLRAVTEVLNRLGKFRFSNGEE